jgi:alpha-tubulin suppressor-like RCC1 family protein
VGVLPIAIVVALAACYRPAADVACSIRCDQGPCPASLECGSDGLCHARNGAVCIDAGVDDAAADGLPDASLSGCIAQIVAYKQTTCALRTDHTVWCWGRNDAGQVGDNTSNNTRGTPTQVMNLTDASAIALGGFAGYAIKTNGDVVSWGSNARGQLGDGTTTDHLTPAAVSVVHNVTELVAANTHVCARDTSNQIYCWGANDFGQTGNGNNTDQHSPQAIMMGLQVVTAGSHTCMRATNNDVKCTGENYYDAGHGGDIGDNTINDRNVPTAVVGPFNAVEIAVGGRDSCGRKSDGTVWCWGQNKFGELGDKTTTESHVPQQVPVIANATALFDTGHRVCARDTTGAVSCWGEDPIATPNSAGGPVNQLEGPHVIAALTAARAIAIASYHECIIDQAGAVECAGRNNEKQLGDNTTTSRTTFAPVPITCP